MLKEKNIIFTCSDCGVETYLTIKEKEKNYKDMVYVWFEISNIVEKMWVWIGQGDQKKGRGFINNQPHLLKDYLKLHDPKIWLQPL